jgi:release factor glutamine methyltransferase
MGDTQASVQRWTIKDVLEWTSSHFRDKGIDTPRLDAEILLAHALGTDRVYLYMNLDRPLSQEERKQFREYVIRRGSREPVALITGVKEFWSIPFIVSPGVLIPRPDTEILVQAVLEEVRDIASPYILEIGTGSGAIAVSLVKENPAVHILAIDIDSTSLEIAQQNAEAAGVAQSIVCVQSDLFHNVELDRKFHVICSNPPYIPSGEIHGLQPEIKDYEPTRALDGGYDGLDIIRGIAVQAKTYLKPGGALILEFGDGQEQALKAILSNEGGFSDTCILRDLAGNPRVAKGRI